MAASIGGQTAGGRPEERGRRDRTGKIPIQLLLSSNAGDPETAPGARQPSTQEQARRYQSGPPTLSTRSSSIPVSFITNPTADGVPAVTHKSTSIDYANGRRMSTTSHPRELEREDSVATSDFMRRPRAPRPSYSEEQKFFIMYARIMQDHSWPEIEDQFAEIFGQRTKGGLTSVYYRVRKDWGLSEVLKSGPGSFAVDCKEVERRAQNFSAAFLTQIGYLGRR